MALTARGWDCIQAAETIFADVERRWADVVGADRIARLRANLRRIVADAGAGAPPLRLRPVW